MAAQKGQKSTSYPAEGDTTREAIYLSVGKALTQWEMLEAALFVLFLQLVGIRNSDTYAMERAYGSVVSSSGRLDMIKAAREAFFTRMRSNTAEQLGEECLVIINQCAKLIGRRNEIAHGYVETYSDAEITHPHTGFVLRPAYFNSNKNTPSYHAVNFPIYLYTSKEITSYGEAFEAMLPKLEDIVERLQKLVAPRQ